MGQRINDPTWAPDSLLTEAIQPDDSYITQQAIGLLESKRLSPSGISGANPAFKS